MKAAGREKVSLSHLLTRCCLNDSRRDQSLASGLRSATDPSPVFRAALRRRRISIIKNAVPHFPSPSQTPVPPRMSVSSCDQSAATDFQNGQTALAWRAWERSEHGRCPAEQLRGCLLSIVACRTSLPSPLNASDWLPTGLAAGIHHLL